MDRSVKQKVQGREAWTGRSERMPLLLGIETDPRLGFQLGFDGAELGETTGMISVRALLDAPDWLTVTVPIFGSRGFLRRAIISDESFRDETLFA